MSDHGAPDAATSRVKLIETAGRGFQTLSDDKIFVTAELSYAFDLSDFIQSGATICNDFFLPDLAGCDVTECQHRVELVIVTDCQLLYVFNIKGDSRLTGIVWSLFLPCINMCNVYSGACLLMD